MLKETGTLLKAGTKGHQIANGDALLELSKRLAERLEEDPNPGRRKLDPREREDLSQKFKLYLAEKTERGFSALSDGDIESAIAEALESVRKASQPPTDPAADESPRFVRGSVFNGPTRGTRPLADT